MFKDAANWTAMKLVYARWIKEEQLEVVDKDCPQKVDKGRTVGSGGGIFVWK